MGAERGDAWLQISKEAFKQRWEKNSRRAPPEISVPSGRFFRKFRGNPSEGEIRRGLILQPNLKGGSVAPGFLCKKS